MGAFVDHHGIRNGHGLAVDGEDHAVVVHVVVARIDVDSARSQVVGRQLADGDLRVENTHHADRDGRRHAYLHHPAVTIEEADVLQQVVALLVQRRNRKLVARRGDQMQRRIETRPDQLPRHGHVDHRRGVFRFPAEGGLHRHWDVDAGHHIRDHLQ